MKLGNQTNAKFQNDLLEAMEGENADADLIDLLKTNQNMSLFQVIMVAYMHNKGLLVMKEDGSANHLVMEAEDFDSGSNNTDTVSNTEPDLTDFEKELDSITLVEWLTEFVTQQVEDYDAYETPDDIPSCDEYVSESSEESTDPDDELQNEHLGIDMEMFEHGSGYGVWAW